MNSFILRPALIINERLNSPVSRFQWLFWKGFLQKPFQNDQLDQRTFQTGIKCPFEIVVLCLGAENIQNRHPERCRF